MKRIQVYLSDELDEKLRAEASNKGVSVSALVLDLIKRKTGNLAGKPIESDLMQKVHEEVSYFIADLDDGREFDLTSASDTYNKIDEICEDNARSVKAKIGRNFAAHVGKPGKFEYVSVSLRENGKIKRNSVNAIVYKVDKNKK